MWSRSPILDSIIRNLSYSIKKVNQGPNDVQRLVILNIVNLIYIIITE